MTVQINELRSELERSLDVDFIVQIASELISIESHRDAPGRERRCAERIAELFSGWGMQPVLATVLEDRPNIYCTLQGSGSGPSLMFNGHTDTVPAYQMDIPPFKPEVRGGLLYWRGSVDMKGQLACMIAAMKLLKDLQASLAGDVIFSGVINEEDRSEGTEYLVAQGPKADRCVVGEPTGLQIMVGHRGLEWLEFQFIGKAAHGGTPEKGINAISKAARFIRRVEERLMPELSKRVHPIIGPAVMNFGVIRGGTQPSSVADNCIVQIVIASVTNFDMYYVVVRVETDAGITGYGEATPAWEVTGETWQSVEACVDLFADGRLLGYSLIGCEIGSLEAVREVMETVEPRQDIRLVYGNPSAIAALEQAMLDACGKAAGKPLYEMFGACNAPIPFTRNISIFDVETTLSRVEAGIRQGFGIIRLKVGLRGAGGLPKYERDYQVVRQSRQVIRDSGKPILLISDANQGFRDVESAIVFCQRVEGMLDWLEQPTLASDLLAFAKIKRAASVPLMADEAVHGYEQARLLLELGGVDYINIKLMKTGGLLRALDIFDLAQGYGVKCQIGSMLESSLGASMGCHAALIRPGIVSTDLNSYDLLRENFASGLHIEGVQLKISQDPGCGMNFDEKELDRYALPGCNM